MPTKPNSQSRRGVFISYSRTDGEAAAHALHARLCAEVPDIPAWLDRFEIEGGIGWWNQIEQELDRAEFLLLVMTPFAMQSENTRREWRSARQRGVCVYPVKGALDAELEFAGLPNWMRKAHFYDPKIEWDKLVAHLRKGCQTTRVPFMAPALPAGFVPRPREFQAVLAVLSVGENARPAPTIALRGPGGFGKTTLATAICHDNACIDAFDDGILWVTLGQSPNLLNELVKVYAALVGERPGFVDVEDAARELAVKLENKNCLIVIDDAWSSGHVRPFLIGGPGCAHLVTTRLSEVTFDARRIDIGQMTPAEAVQLLLARTDTAPTDIEPFHPLAKRLGYWPLPIKLAGAAVRQRLERRDTLAHALDYVRRSLEKRGITAFDKENMSSREEAVASSIGASLDLLSPEDQSRCAELTIFQADVVIPIGAAATLWQLDDIDSEDLARKFDEFALVELDLQLGVLRIHDELREFLVKRIPDVPSVHRRLIDAWGNPLALPGDYAWRAYSYHMHRANADVGLRELLLNIEWLEAKLAATDIHSLIADFEYSAADPSLGLLRDALRLSAPALAADPGQLRSQIVGRLLARREPDIIALCEASTRSRRRAWLRFRHPSLDPPGGMLTVTLMGHGEEVVSLATDADFDRLVSASNDRTLRIWDLRKGQLIRVLHPAGNRLGMRAVAVSDDGRLAVSSGANGVTYFWDVTNGELLHHSRDHHGPKFVALSADGHTALCAARSSPLIVWDVATRTVRRTFGNHPGNTSAVCLSADGTRAVSALDDGTLRVWDLRDAAFERVLEGHQGAVNAVALSEDGRYALSGSDDRMVRLWDVDRGACLQTLTGHERSVIAVDLAADARRAVSASSEGNVKLWGLEQGTLLAQLEGHIDAVRAIAINRSGTRAATGSADCTIKLWRLDNLLATTPVEAHVGVVRMLVFSPDGRLCASGGNDGRVTVRDVDSGQVVRSIEAHTAPVTSLAFTEDSGCVLSRGVEDKCWQWVIESAERIPIPVAHWAPVDSAAMSATARYLVTACADQYVYVRDMPSGTQITRYGTRRLFDHLIEPAARRQELSPTDNLLDTYLPGEAVYKVHVVKMSPDGRQALLSASVNNIDSVIRALPSRRQVPSSDVGCIVALNLNNGELDSIRVPQSDPIGAFAVDASGKRLLLATLGHALELWDLKREERISVMRGHTHTINAVGFGQDGTYAYSCGRDQTLRVWDLRRNLLCATFTADAALCSLALGPDDQHIAVGDISGRVHLLSLES